jgi:molybdopterin-containing oxidoreductase family iron-sulfur binding subunit
VVWDSWVEINLSTAEAKGIREGDILEVKSSNGTIEAPAYPHPGVPPWAVNMPIGQGHTSFGRYAEGVGSNTISILAPVMDADTRSLAWAATRVSITNTGRTVDLPKYEGAVLAVEADDPGRVIKITGLDSH